MYIRIKTAPNRERKSVQIVQSVRDGNKVKQKIVRHVGMALSDFELEKLKDLAEYIKANIENEDKPMLYKPEELAELAIEARKKSEEQKSLRVNLKKLEEEQRIVSGIHEVYGKLFHELDFDDIFNEKKTKSRHVRLLKNIVMARIANPKSKRGSILMLENDFGIKLNLEHGGVSELVFGPYAALASSSEMLMYNTYTALSETFAALPTNLPATGRPNTSF